MLDGSHNETLSRSSPRNLREFLTTASTYDAKQQRQHMTQSCLFCALGIIFDSRLDCARAALRGMTDRLNEGVGVSGGYK